jgi:putative phosphoribosyl transferase
MYFYDRFDAGRKLTERLWRYRNRSDVTVLALPRGGVPVAFEVAKALDAPLDVFLVRKLGMPGHDELAMGAVANGNVEILNEAVVSSFNISREQIDSIAERERRRIRQQQDDYRHGEPPLEIKGRVVMLVDDGVATGATMRAAVAALRRHHPKRIVVAVPVGALETCDELKQEADEVVCLVSPQQFYAVGMWYRDFSPTTDEAVQELLQQSHDRQHATSDAS